MNNCENCRHKTSLRPMCWNCSNHNNHEDYNAIQTHQIQTKECYTQCREDYELELGGRGKDDY